MSTAEIQYVSDHPNSQVLKRIYSTVADGLSGDEPAAVLRASIKEPFVVHAVGAAVGGEFRGLDAHLEHVNRLIELSDGTVRESVFSITADDTFGMVAQVMRAERGDRSLTIPVAGAWRFNSDGLLVEHWETVSDLAAWDEFWC